MAAPASTAVAADGSGRITELMAVVLQVQEAYKRYGDQHLLSGASCAIADDQKVGLIGRNGAGKSTLCRILLGDEELDAGEVVCSKKLRLGYLRQHDPFLPGESVLQFLMRDSQQPEWRCGEVAWQFAFPDASLDQPVKELSGGWQTRAKLAALLLHDPNLLLLDEPTNFLDLRTQMLLEHFLQQFKGGCLIISHDRTFLKKTCSHTLELFRGKLTMYPGDVDAYLENVEERREHDRRANAATAAKMKQLERFIVKNRANASTASQAKSKAKQLERLELVEVEEDDAKIRFRFPEMELRKGPALLTEELEIGYPEKSVAGDVRVEVDHGSRVGIVGDNGQGKTTFLRTICGSLDPRQGGLKWGFGCQLGVYAQHVYTTLPEEKTVEEYLDYESVPGTTIQQIKDVAGSFLFRGTAMEKKIKVLSGGERARLVLAGLLLQQNNVLILDEPGNHLDVETVEALAEALCRYQGTVIFTSHDRHFVQQVATQVIEVGGGAVVSYPSSYDDYVYRVQREIDAGQRNERGTRGSETPADAGDVQASQGRDAHNAQKRLKAVERKIQKLDQKKQKIHAELMNVTDPDQAINLQRELDEIGSEIEKLEEEWFELQ